MVIINKVHERRLFTFSFVTGLSYKESKNHPHLTEFKDLFTAFSLSFMQLTLSIYMCCSELSASQDFLGTSVFNKLNIPCVNARRVLILSRY